jgi:hypothetical protein
MGGTTAMQIDRSCVPCWPQALVLFLAVGLTSSCIDPAPIQESHLNLFNHTENAEEIMSLIET